MAIHMAYSTGRDILRIAKLKAEIDEAVNIITELHEQLKEERDDVIWLDAEDFIQQHKGE